MTYQPGPKRAMAPLNMGDLPSAGAERVAAFIESHAVVTTGRYARQRVRLRPWQRDILDVWFGPPRARRAYLQIPRKNAKSTVAAWVGLYGLIADDEEGAEVYSIASSLDQAKIIWGIAKRIVEMSPTLRRCVQVYRDRLVYEPLNSVFAPLAADVDTRQGLNPSMVLFDEVHTQPDSRLWDTMAMGQGAREDPIMVGLTTPGYDDTSFAHTLCEMSREPDSGIAGVIYEPSNPECDHGDESAWYEANPALGDWLSVDDMRLAYRTTDEATFRRFRLGQWTATATRWIDAATWASVGETGPPLLERQRVVLAFDGSLGQDSTALVACRVPDMHIAVVGHWEGLSTPGYRVPRSEVNDTVAAAFDTYDVVALVADPPYWEREISEWSARWPDRVIGFPTYSRIRMAPACAAFHAAVAERSVSHDGNPELARHIANANTANTPYGTVITKSHKDSPAHIDLAIAAVLAYWWACTKLAAPSLAIPSIW